MKINEVIKGDPGRFTTIIGVDIGHGETSAALLLSDGFTTYDLALTGQGEKKIVSACFLADSGEVKVGEGAVNELATPGKRYLKFKDRPDRLRRPFPDDSRTRGEILKAFFAQVIETLYQYNPNYLRRSDRESTLLFVGCPSSEDWLYQEREYAQTLTEAAGMPVVIMPESRASLIKTYREKGQILQVNEGVMVFDSGSSTLDATYIFGGGKDPYRDLSKRVGAALIEERMLDKALGDLGFSREDLADPLFTELHFRIAKERYFCGEPNLFVALSLLPGKSTGPVPVVIDDPFMNQVIHGMEITYISENTGKVRKPSWADACRDFFREAKALVGDGPLSTVICTGGASRMPFLQRLCREVFTEQTIEIDYDPSYCVSRGLAIAGKTDLKCVQTMETTALDIREEIESATGLLASTIAQAFGRAVYQITLEELRSWAEPEETADTLEQVTGRIRENTALYLAGSQGRDRLRGCFDSWLDQLKGRITAVVNRNFAEHFPSAVSDLPAFVIDDADWNRLCGGLLDGVDAFSVDDIDLSGLLELVLYLVAMPLLLVTALVDGVFKTDLTTGVSGMLDSLNGKAGRPLRKSKRMRILENFIEKKDEHLAKIRSNLSASMGQRLDERKESIAREIYECLQDPIAEAIDQVSLHFSA